MAGGRPWSPAYLVNDVYRKYIKADATERTYVRLSYVAGWVVDTKPSRPTLNEFNLLPLLCMSV